MAKIVKRSSRPPLEQAICDLESKRSQKAELDAEIKALQGEVLELMGDAKTSRAVAIDGRELKVTRIQNTSLLIDPESLKTKIGIPLWNKITTRVMDKKKLEAFVASGEISEIVVADCSSESLGSPFVKVTVSPAKTAAG